MPTRVEPDVDGWYICYYPTIADMMLNQPGNVLGPYPSETEAKRAVAQTTDLDNADELEEKRVKPYDPSRDPTPAAYKARPSLDAGIPTDNDEAEASSDESV